MTLKSLWLSTTSSITASEPKASTNPHATPHENSSISPRRRSPTSRLTKFLTKSSASSRTSNSSENPRRSDKNREKKEDHEPKRLKYGGPVSKEHQQLLDSFEWNFGRKRSCESLSSWHSGISPRSSLSLMSGCASGASTMDSRVEESADEEFDGREVSKGLRRVGGGRALRDKVREEDREGLVRFE